MGDSNSTIRHDSTTDSAYVGRHYVSFVCSDSETSAKNLTAVGSCSEDPRQPLVIDDKKGTIQIPSGDSYTEVSVSPTLIYNQRLSHNYDHPFVDAEYFIFGPDEMSDEDLSLIINDGDHRVDADVYGAILDRVPIKDLYYIPRSPSSAPGVYEPSEIFMEALSFWLNVGESESLYYDKALAIIDRLFSCLDHQMTSGANVNNVALQTIELIKLVQKEGLEQNFEFTNLFEKIILEKPTEVSTFQIALALLSEIDTQKAIAYCKKIALNTDYNVVDKRPFATIKLSNLAPEQSIIYLEANAVDASFQIHQRRYFAKLLSNISPTHSIPCLNTLALDPTMRSYRSDMAIDLFEISPKDSKSCLKILAKDSSIDSQTRFYLTKRLETLDSNLTFEYFELIAQDSSAEAKGRLLSINEIKKSQPHLAIQYLSEIGQNLNYDVLDRLEAAKDLERLSSHSQAAIVYASVAFDQKQFAGIRFKAAELLMKVDPEKGIQCLEVLINDDTMAINWRLKIIETFEVLTEHSSDKVITALKTISLDQNYYSPGRIKAAVLLNSLSEKDAIFYLTALSEDSTTGAYHRLDATLELIDIDPNLGVICLETLSLDKDVYSDRRYSIARVLYEFDSEKGLKAMNSIFENTDDDNEYKWHAKYFISDHKPQETEDKSQLYMIQ